MKVPQTKLSPWARIVKAMEAGRGLRLSADEVLRLSQDGALMTRGRADLDGDDE